MYNVRHFGHDVHDIAIFMYVLYLLVTNVYKLLWRRNTLRQTCLTISVDTLQASKSEELKVVNEVCETFYIFLQVKDLEAMDWKS